MIILFEKCLSLSHIDKCPIMCMGYRYTNRLDNHRKRCVSIKIQTFNFGCRVRKYLIIDWRAFKALRQTISFYQWNDVLTQSLCRDINRQQTPLDLFPDDDTYSKHERIILIVTRKVLYLRMYLSVWINIVSIG